MKEIPSYVKDTNAFINKINNHNIPRVDIYHTWCKISLYKHTKPRRNSSCQKGPQTLSTQNSSNKGHNYFLALILTLNNFKFYLQIKVHAVSTICAPSDAKIFMAYFKEKFIYPLIRNATTLYLCYFDDTILIRTKSENELLRSIYKVWNKILQRQNRISQYLKTNLLNNFGVWKTYKKLEKATNKERLSRNYSEPQKATNQGSSFE